MVIKLFADTANLKEIEECFSMEVNDGITTNPKIIESTADLPLGFENSFKKMLEKHGSIRDLNINSENLLSLTKQSDKSFEKACRRLMNKYLELGIGEIIENSLKHASKQFDNLPVGFEKACKKILEKYPNVPVSLETDLRGINPNEICIKKEEIKEILLSQAYSLSRLGKNAVIKIPICEPGVSVVKILSEEGIKTNVTACITPYQAIEAARAGATYVSLFANRMLDSYILELSGLSLLKILKQPDWKDKLKEKKEQYFEQAWELVLKQIAYVADKIEKYHTELIVGSIRTPEDIYKIAKAHPHIITIPPKIVAELKNIHEIKKTNRIINHEAIDLLYHPMTEYTLEEFEKAADSYRK